MVTMKDVAEKAGVSVTTVSHVINKTRFVSDDAVKKVTTAISTLEYYPSAIARSLKSDQTHTIGMIIPNNSNPYFAEIIHEIEKNCFDAGYNLILCNAGDSQAKQAAYIKILMEKRIDGLIVISSGTDKELIDLLSRRKVPKVIIDRKIDGIEADLVETDNYAGGYRATQYLIELGHSQIACIAGPGHLSSACERVKGYLKCLADHQITHSPDFLCRGNFLSQSGFEAMKALLSNPKKPTAVFVSNDLMALGALCALHEENIKVPDEISIIGFDDIKLATFSSPPLTTIAHQKAETGRIVASLITRRIKDKTLEHEHIHLKPELVIRKSTASCKDSNQ
jgi:LacI family transcriptional regulator